MRFEFKATGNIIGIIIDKETGKEYECDDRGDMKDLCIKINQLLVK